MYKHHCEIPRPMRTVILQETGETRVTNVPLALCNEIVEELYEYEQTMAELLNFKLLVEYNDGTMKVYRHDNVKGALAKLDELNGYLFKNESISSAVLFQADKPIRAWSEGVEINLPRKHNDVQYI